MSNEIKKGTYSFGVSKLHIEQNEPTYSVQLWSPGCGYGPFTTMTARAVRELVTNRGVEFDESEFVIPNFSSYEESDEPT